MNFGDGVVAQESYWMGVSNARGPWIRRWQFGWESEGNSHCI